MVLELEHPCHDNRHVLGIFDRENGIGKLALVWDAAGSGLEFFFDFHFERRVLVPFVEREFAGFDRGSDIFHRVAGDHVVLEPFAGAAAEFVLAFFQEFLNGCGCF